MDLQSPGTSSGLTFSAPMDTTSGRKRKSTGSPPETAKRKKTGSAGPYRPALQFQNGLWTIPNDLARRNGILRPPSPEERLAINAFQQKNLESRDSRIHNQGVHLKTGAEPVSEFQVVAVYEGDPLRGRFLDKEELEAAGCSTHQDDYKWLIWKNPGSEPEVSVRLPCFQAANHNIVYRDDKGRGVWMGVDAIDSPYPISHINHSSQQANILLLSCVHPDLIQCENKKELILKSSPSDSEFCFVAVASQNITPGEELLLNYDPCQDERMHGYFWGPEHYFIPALTPEPVTVDFSYEGVSATVTPGGQRRSVQPVELKKQIDALFCQGFNVEQVAARLDMRFYNPMSDNSHWTPGAVQYVCELLNIEHFEMCYKYLSYLCYCLGPGGKLDNFGKNYLAGFVRQCPLPLELPKVPPETIEEVIIFLETALTAFDIRNVERSAEAAMRRELQQLLRELRTLKLSLQSSSVDTSLEPSPLSTEIAPDPDVRQDDILELQSLDQARVRILGIVEQAKITQQQGSQKAHHLTSTICYRLNAYFPWSPATLWPDKLRSASWRSASLRCLHRLLPPVPEDIKKPDDFDVLACYRADTPEYLESLKKVLVQEQRAGASKQDIIVKMSSKGFCGRSRPGRQADNNACAYLIPHLESIPQTLRGTSQWSLLEPLHWQELGLASDTLAPLRKNIERIASQSSYDSARVNICSNMAHLWDHLPDIKPSIKALKPKSVALLNYLVHISDACLPQAPSRTHCWRPLDSLQVCLPDTASYREAMSLLISESLTNGLNAYDIARTLERGNPHSALHFVTDAIRNATRIELPEVLQANGHKRWTPEAIVQLMSHYEIQVPQDVTLLPDTHERLKTLVQQWVSACKVPTQEALEAKLRNNFKRDPQVATELAEHLELDPEKISRAIPSAIRVVLHELGVPVDRLPSKSQEKFQIQGADKFNVITQDHPEWKSRLLNIVSFYLEQGHSLSYIAYRLGKGSKNTAELAFAPVPLPGHFSGDSWDYEALRQFLQEQGVDVDALTERYPQSKSCLEMEAKTRIRHRAVSLRDGMLIDRMLSPCYAGEPEDKNRLRKMSVFIKKDILWGGVRVLMRCFEDLKTGQ